MAQTWDAIVIGSGIGGMTAAALLAKVGRMRVLVLEKHSERGGLTHVFRRDGASWDVGVHYLGDMQPGSTIRVLFNFLSGSALGWNAMPDDFERFIYPGGLDFAVPSDPHRYEERLIQRFPNEAAAVRRYFSDVKEVANWHVQGTMQSMLPWPLSFLVAQWRRLGAWKAMQTTGEYLNRHFKSTELKALLATQWADYGLPPSESAFALHALVVRSYLHGAWFPKGGASRIARTFEVDVEANGGAIKVCQDVTAILANEQGAHVTYQRLLPTDGEIGRRTAAVRDCINRLDGGLSCVTLYLRLDKPIATLGIKGENYWINTTFEHDNIDAQTDAVLAGKPQHAYMSFPSAKSGHDARFHTAEVLSLVKAEAFSAWRQTGHGVRGKEYMELKSRIAQGLLDLADSATPGLKALVRYFEVSTPLTVEDFTSHPAGAIYGLKGTPDRYACRALSSASAPISGLHLSGSDASSLGVAGALMGGVVAASRVLGPLGLFRIMRMAHQNPPPPLTGSAAISHSPEKKRAVVVAKTALTASIWRLEFQLDGDEPIRCTPGQYLMLRVAPFEWRNYTIAWAEGQRFTLLVSTRTGGDGSLYAGTVQPGAETEVELPFGAFHLQHNSHRKVFIATGTGLAPFLPMSAALTASGDLPSAELLFGCALAVEDVTRALAPLHPLPRTTVCVDADPAAKGVFHGRVTEALSSLVFDPAATDFYVCGSPAMMEDCRSILVRAGATQILTEPF